MMQDILRIVVWLTSVFAVCATQADEAFVLRTPDVAVTTSDIEHYIFENLPEDESKRLALLSKPGVYRDMAESLLILRTIAGEAEKEMNLSEEQIKWASQIAYQRKLVDRYKTFYLRKVFEDTDWDSMAKEAYVAEKDAYKMPERVSVAHILINAKDRNEAEALALITKLRARALAGDDFEAMAREFSDDSSVERNGGNLGFFARGRMVPEFEKAAFSMKKAGSISKVVKTQFGFHIIKLLDRQEEGPLPFEKAKAKIIDELQTQLSGQVWQDKLIALRSNPNIVLDQDVLDTLKKKYAPNVEIPGVK